MLKNDRTIKTELDDLLEFLLKFGKDRVKKYSRPRKLKKFLKYIKINSITWNNQDFK